LSLPGQCASLLPLCAKNIGILGVVLRASAAGFETRAERGATGSETRAERVVAWDSLDSGRIKVMISPFSRPPGLHFNRMFFRANQ
jgi:hypothetical protein